MPDTGILTAPSLHSVDETLAILEHVLAARGITVFACVDHSGEAAKVGLTMPNTKLLIFGNPKGGTPLMLAAPSIALDLPIKLLIAEDAHGKVWISWNDPAWLQHRHGVPPALLPNLAFLGTLVEAIAA